MTAPFTLHPIGVMPAMHGYASAGAGDSGAVQSLLRALTPCTRPVTALPITRCVPIFTRRTHLLPWCQRKAGSRPLLRVANPPWGNRSSRLPDRRAPYFLSERCAIRFWHLDVGLGSKKPQG